MKIVVFDTETTGLPLHPSADIELQPRIIEFAAAMVDSKKGKIVGTYSQLINPLVEISAIITKITGIENGDLLDKPVFTKVLPDIEAFFKKADVMLAHNLKFDVGMLHFDMRRNMIDPAGFPWPKREGCTVQLYTEEFGHYPKMTELYESKMGKPLAQTHRAMDDVEALAEIVIKEKLWLLFPS